MSKQSYCKTISCQMKGSLGIHCCSTVLDEISLDTLFTLRSVLCINNVHLLFTSEDCQTPRDKQCYKRECKRCSLSRPKVLTCQMEVTKLVLYHGSRAYSSMITLMTSVRLRNLSVTGHSVWTHIALTYRFCFTGHPTHVYIESIILIARILA